MKDKDYAVWHELKRQVHKRPPLQNFHEREIWWCSLGENVGFEEDGKNALFERPVLIVRKFNKELFIGLPLTTKQKDNFYHHPITIAGVPGSVIISQVRVLSSRRLQRKVERLGAQQFLSIVGRLESVVLKKSIPADFSAGSPVPSGNLYVHSTENNDKSQEEQL